jgi:hypothetical protein
MFERMRLLSGVVAVVFALLMGAGMVAADTPRPASAALVELYVPMQEALAGDSAAKVKEQAAKLAAEASAAAKAGGDKAGLEAVANAAKAMTANDIAGLRDQFKPVSMALAKLVEKESVAGHGIYFCPMADAYWVQKSGDVANPYYGKSMLRCGQEVKKVEG